MKVLNGLFKSKTGDRCPFCGTILKKRVISEKKIVECDTCGYFNTRTK